MSGSITRSEVEEGIDILNQMDEISLRSELYFALSLFARQDKILLFSTIKEPGLCFEWLRWRRRVEHFWTSIDCFLVTFTIILFKGFLCLTFLNVQFFYF